MIIVDASVLIDYLRNGDAALLATMQANGAALCGATRAEILHGARGPKHRQKLVQLLNTFSLVSMPDAAWDTVGDNLAVLRANGLTVQFPDAIVATIAILLDVEAWARDQHFPAMQKFLPALKLFPEPP
jgi:predicted nucleic acid-binding protein